MYRNKIKFLQKWKASRARKPLILQGARQVGKTYLLKQFGKDSFSAVHYLNFEKNEELAPVFQKDLSPLRIVKELEFLLDSAINIEQDLLIFDEIQHLPRALTSLKYFCEEMPEMAVCAAGSLLGITLSEGSFPVGKVLFMELKPMNFNEFIRALEENRLLTLLESHDFRKPLPSIAHNKLFELWKRYLVVGGLPEVVHYFSENRDDEYRAMKHIRSMQENLQKTYLADMAKHSGKTNAMHIEQVWRSIPDQLAKTMDSNSKRFIFKDVIKGVRGYQQLSSPIGWLERSDLIKRIPIVETSRLPLTAFAKENYFKLYFFDIGMLGAISNLSPISILSYDFKTYKGYVAENAVLQELLSCENRPLFCWVGRTSEIEFLLESDGDVFPVEVKSGNSLRAKSLKVYRDKYSPDVAIIVSARNEGLRGDTWYFPLYAADKIFALVDELQQNKFLSK